jgi:putative membrane protein
LAAGAYLHMPWMHAKLTCALVVIGVHHVIGARTRRIASGHAEAGRGMPLLAGVLFAAAAGAVLLAVYKSLP